MCEVAENRPKTRQRHGVFGMSTDERHGKDMVKT